jgi:hypothetical protein
MNDERRMTGKLLDSSSFIVPSSSLLLKVGGKSSSLVARAMNG